MADAWEIIGILLPIGVICACGRSREPHSSMFGQATLAMSEPVEGQRRTGWRPLKARFGRSQSACPSPEADIN